jgi:hypothetical protein
MSKSIVYITHMFPKDGEQGILTAVQSDREEAISHAKEAVRYSNCFPGMEGTFAYIQAWTVDGGMIEGIRIEEEVCG